MKNSSREPKRRTRSLHSPDIRAFQRAAVYGRVSAPKQEEDLKRQLAFLTRSVRAAGYHEVLIYKDIASGLNDNRAGLKRLMRDALARKFSAIFITHRDRLARFGLSLLYQVLDALHVEIIEINADPPKKQGKTSPEKELVNDVLAILTSCSGKLYRMHRGSCS